MCGQADVSFVVSWYKVFSVSALKLAQFREIHVPTPYIIKECFKILIRLSMDLFQFKNRTVNLFENLAAEEVG